MDIISFTEKYGMLPDGEAAAAATTVVVVVVSESLLSNNGENNNEEEEEILQRPDSTHLLVPLEEMTASNSSSDDDDDVVVGSHDSNGFQGDHEKPHRQEERNDLQINPTFNESPIVPLEVVEDITHKNKPMSEASENSSHTALPNNADNEENGKLSEGHDSENHGSSQKNGNSSNNNNMDEADNNSWTVNEVLFHCPVFWVRKVTSARSRLVFFFYVNVFFSLQIIGISIGFNALLSTGLMFHMLCK